MPQEIVQIPFAAVCTSPLLTRPTFDVGWSSCLHLSCTAIVTQGQVRGGSSSVLNCLKGTVILKAVNGHTTSVVFNI